MAALKRFAKASSGARTHPHAPPLKKHHEENVSIIREELAYPGVSVIIPRRECIVAIDKRMRDKYKARNVHQQ